MKLITTAILTLIAARAIAVEPPRFPRRTPPGRSKAGPCAWTIVCSKAKPPRKANAR